ncbi:alpha/beta hydrolase [Nocardia vulneris]|uniref:alpha/beta hydrolase n=1 Tax=Nocardia vulneris TaxID=1141657 RepID=UPI0030D5E3B4
MTAPALATVSPLHPAVVAELPRRASLRLRAAHAVLHATVRQFFELAVWVDRNRLLTPSQMLAITTRVDPLLMPLRPQRGTGLRAVSFPDFRAEWVWGKGIPDPDQQRDTAILYFHGGGLLSCGLHTHRRLVGRISNAVGAPVFNVDYRQIPRAHVTETVQDCLTAYRHLLDNGFPADRIIFAGDSAGGGLTFSLALAARDHGLPMPAALVAIAPWANYDSTVKRAHPNTATDAILSADAYALPAKWGVAVDGRFDPAWSPVNHNLTGLPPTLVQVGSTETLLADSEQLAARCAEAAVPLTLQIWDNAIHVFQAGADLLPDARDAIAEIGRFARAALEAASTRTTASVRTPA